MIKTPVPQWVTLLIFDLFAQCSVLEVEIWGWGSTGCLRYAMRSQTQTKGLLKLNFFCLSLGDEFEILPDYERFAEVKDVTADLANPGNVLIRASNGDFYTTTNHKNFTRLNTDNLIDDIPDFFQISPNIIVFQTRFFTMSLDKNDKNCLCQLDRISKKISPVYISDQSYCVQNCTEYTEPFQLEKLRTEIPDI